MCICLYAYVCVRVCLAHEYNPNVSEFGFLPDPKTGEEDGVHAAQKLGYAVLNVAARRLSQEEVKLMRSTQARTRTVCERQGKLCIIFRGGKLSLCIGVIIKQLSAD